MSNNLQEGDSVLVKNKNIKGRVTKISENGKYRVEVEFGEDELQKVSSDIRSLIDNKKYSDRADLEQAILWAKIKNHLTTAYPFVIKEELEVKKKQFFQVFQVDVEQQAEGDISKEKAFFILQGLRELQKEPLNRILIICPDKKKLEDWKTRFTQLFNGLPSKTKNISNQPIKIEQLQLKDFQKLDKNPQKLDKNPSEKLNISIIIGSEVKKIQEEKYKYLILENFFDLIISDLRKSKKGIQNQIENISNFSKYSLLICDKSNTPQFTFFNLDKNNKKSEQLFLLWNNRALSKTSIEKDEIEMANQNPFFTFINSFLANYYKTCYKITQNHQEQDIIEKIELQDKAEQDFDSFKKQKKIQNPTDLQNIIKNNNIQLIKKQSKKYNTLDSSHSLVRWIRNIYEKDKKSDLVKPPLLSSCQLSIADLDDSELKKEIQGEVSLFFLVTPLKYEGLITKRKLYYSAIKLLDVSKQEPLEPKIAEKIVNLAQDKGRPHSNPQTGTESLKKAYTELEKKAKKAQNRFKEELDSQDVKKYATDFLEKEREETKDRYRKIQQQNIDAICQENRKIPNQNQTSNNSSTAAEDIKKEIEIEKYCDKIQEYANRKIEELKKIESAEVEPDDIITGIIYLY